MKVFNEAFVDSGEGDDGKRLQKIEKAARSGNRFGGFCFAWCAISYAVCIKRLMNYVGGLQVGEIGQKIQKRPEWSLCYADANLVDFLVIQTV